MPKLKLNSISYYILKRCIQAILAFFVITTLIFAYYQINGQYSTVLDDPRLLPEDQARLEFKYGGPVLIQYLYFMADVIMDNILFQGLLFFFNLLTLGFLDLRTEPFDLSLHYRMPVMEVMLRNFILLDTLYLLAAATVLAVTVYFLLRKIKVFRRLNRFSIVGITVLYPILWFYLFKEYIVFEQSFFITLHEFLPLPMFGIQSMEPRFTALFSVQVLDLDLTIMEPGWYIDRLLHLIVPSCFVLIALIPLILLFTLGYKFINSDTNVKGEPSDIEDVVHRNLSIKFGSIDFSLPIIAVIFVNVYFLFEYLKLLEVILAWTGLMRRNWMANATKDWFLAIGTDVMIWSLILVLTVVLDLLHLFVTSRQVSVK